MDIDSRGEYPARALSNFAPNSFVMNGDIECASMEGFLQSLKFEDPDEQKKLRGLIGVEAKFKGSTRNYVWQRQQKLWFRGTAYGRHEPCYQILLDNAFLALSKNPNFEKALLATGTSRLTHTIGETDATKTCLTAYEFCTRLIKIRNRLRL